MHRVTVNSLVKHVGRKYKEIVGNFVFNNESSAFNQSLRLILFLIIISILEG